MGGAAPDLSVVIPACNEADNVGPLAHEIDAALRGCLSFEIVFVDDGSSDATAAAVLSVRRHVAGIRLLRHAERRGQSAAIHTGVRAARAAWVATLDGDGQNDPADIARLLAARDADPSFGLLVGHRIVRMDSWQKRLSSRVANRVRARLLGDGTPDTGCGLKLFRRAVFLELPYFDHMHRFLPALFRRQGVAVVSVPVGHRRRERGHSKYGVGHRLWVGIFDLCGVRWLIARRHEGTQVTEE